MMPRKKQRGYFFVQKEKDIIPLLLECPLQAILSHSKPLLWQCIILKWAIST